MKTLITKYLNDTISEAEKNELIEWLQTPQNQKTFKEFVKINHRLNTQYVQIDDGKAYLEVKERIRKSSAKTQIRKLIPQWLKYAAVIVGVAFVGYGVYINSPLDNTVPVTPQITLQLEDGSIFIIEENSNNTIVNSEGKKISQQKSNQLIYDEKISSEILMYNTLSIPNGKIFKLSLSDGSQVVLNAGTTLKYPVNFLSGQDRTVFLNGEAYFEIAEDLEHPFIVNTEDMELKVLGTHFNVNSYSETHKTFTVLVEGKVMAKSTSLSEDQKLLKPYEKVFFENNQLKVENVDVQKYVAWVQGQLVFVNDSFEVIVKKLERKYNVEIVNNYSILNDINITATFTNESIEEVLKTFQAYKNFDWTLKNGVVTINKPKY